MSPDLEDQPHSQGGSRQTVPCRVCNREVASDARTCPSCGTNDPWRIQLKVDAAEKQSARNFGLGCLAVIGGIALIFFLLFMFSSPDEAGRCSSLKSDLDRKAKEGRLVFGDLEHYNQVCGSR